MGGIIHMTRRPAPASVPIHEIISHRWSPRAFEDRAIEPEKLHSLFEAARWASSSSNAQPWFYIVATKDDSEGYRKILDSFVELNQNWAKNAPVLAISVAKLTHDSGKPNRHAFHDVGAASTTLAIEATALGLQVHQMGGILPEKARQNFGIPEGYEAVAGLAIGYPGEASSLAEPLKQRETAPRSRKPLDSFIFADHWGKVSPIVAPKS
jgi:nitroreductase